MTSHPVRGNPPRDIKYRGYKQHIKGGGNIDITSSQGNPPRDVKYTDYKQHIKRGGI